MHHDSQKIKKAVNFIGPVVTRYSFSSETICCSCHANVIMPSAMRLEFLNSRVAPSQEKKMSLTIFLYTYVKVWPHD